MTSYFYYYSLFMRDLVEWVTGRMVFVWVEMTGISLEIDINVEITNNLINLHISVLFELDIKILININMMT